MTGHDDDTAKVGPEALIRRIFDWIDTTAILAAAEVGLADHLAAGPRSAKEVAAELGADEEAIGRLLRDLTGTGVIATVGPDLFTLGLLGEFLRSDVHGSVRAPYRMVGGAVGRGLLGGHASLTGGTPAFEEIFGAPIFEYLNAHPQEGTIFNASMVDMGTSLGTPAVHAYDFSGVRTLVDVGGGRGQLALEVLRTHPELEGIVFDLPAVIQETQAEIERAGLAGRCRAVSGDFFESVPAGGDCYAMRWIIHGWGDQQAATILGCCREAIDPNGRLLLFEIVMPEGDEPHLAKSLDWVMLSCVTGKERTQDEYAALLERSGFRLTRVVPSPTPMSVVEAVPV
jgi:hypothetical protein